MSMMLRLMIMLAVALFFGCDKGDKTGDPAGKAPASKDGKAGKGGKAAQNGKAPAKAAKASVDMLAGVPDDTPYLFANTQPMPKDFLDRIGVAMDPAIKAIEAEMTKSEKALGDSPDDKLAKAFIAELKGNLSRAGMAKMGIDPEFRFVIYGIGFLPAVRMHLSDPKAFKAMIARIEKSSGRKAPTAKQGEIEYWRFANDGMFLAVAVVGEQLVAGFGPDRVAGDMLPALFSQTGGGAGVKARLAQNAKTYGLRAEASGFIDTVALVRGALGTGSALNNTIISKVIGKDLPPISAACKTDYESIAQTWPGVAFGYTELSAKRVAARYVVQAKATIANDLAGLRSSVPGMDAKLGLANVVAGLDVGKTMAFAKKTIEAMKAKPYACENLGAINQGVAAMAMAVAQPLPPAITGLKGVNLQLKSLTMGANGPGDIQATALLVADGADELFAMLKGFVPPLAQVAIKADGKPVALPPGVVPPIVEAPHMAMTKGAVAVSVGKGQEANLAGLVNAKPGAKTPVFYMAYDFQKVMQMTGALQGMPAEEAALMKGFFDLVGQIGYSIDFQSTGIVLDQTLVMP